MGLGIACLTLALSGVTRASTLPVDCGKYGKNDKKIECKDDHKGKDVCFDIKDIKEEIKCLEIELKDLKDDKGGKDEKGCKDIKDDKKHDFCKVDFKKHHEKDLCDFGQDYGHKCDLVLDCGGPSDPNSGWDHACAVPTPAASAMSGAGLFGILLMGWLRSRRSIA
jgi:hypothetical protein